VGNSTIWRRSKLWRRGCQVQNTGLFVWQQMRFKTLSTVVCVYWQQISHWVLKMI
jgi:hypothetical protein